MIFVLFLYNLLLFRVAVSVQISYRNHHVTRWHKVIHILLHIYTFPSSLLIHHQISRKVNIITPYFPYFFCFLKIPIVAFEDPKIEGVTIYLADFERPITEKLQKDFFDDPTSTSLTCARAAAIKVGDINKDPQGEEVFEVNRSLFFKVMK